MSFFRVIVNLFHFNRTNWKAVTFCFLTALVFWFFNALNKDYSTNLRFGVNFQFDQDRYIPVDPLPEAVFMNVSGNGWDLLRKSLGMNKPEMNIPLDRPTEVKKIVGSTLPALIAGQLGNLQINHVVTDTLYLSVDPLEKKKVKVSVDPSAFTFSDGFGRLSPIVVLPDSILLEGPKRLLDNHPDSILLEINEDDISSDFREEIEVSVPNTALIKRNPEVVEVIFEVVEWVEISTKIKLEIQNTPINIRTSLVKDSVQCRIRLPKNQQEVFGQTVGGQVATIDLKGIRRGVKKLAPIVSGLPKHATLLQVDSVSVKLY